MPRCAPLASSSPNYEIWFAPRYPVARIQCSHKQEWSHKAAFLPALLEDVRTRGLINPLIVLNHRPKNEYLERYVMTGVNRLWCVRQLGWETVPAIVTGRIDVEDTVLVEWSDIGLYFPDGEVYLGNQGPRIRGYSNFLKGEFPHAHSRQGVGSN